MKINLYTFPMDEKMTVENGNVFHNFTSSTKRNTDLFIIDEDQFNISKEDPTIENKDDGNDGIKWYGIAILVLAIVGIGINVTAIVIMRKKKGIFHTMLKVHEKNITVLFNSKNFISNDMMVYII